MDWIPTRDGQRHRKSEAVTAWRTHLESIGFAGRDGYEKRKAIFRCWQWAKFTGGPCTHVTALEDPVTFAVIINLETVADALAVRGMAKCVECGRTWFQ